MGAPIGAPFFYLAAIAAAAVVVVVAAVVVAAAAAEQQNQNDDPPAVIATEAVVVAHKNTSKEIFSSGSPLIPCYSAAQKRCSPTKGKCRFQFIVLSKSNYLRCHPERRQTNSKEFACRSRRIYTLTLLCRSNQRIDPSTRFACSG